jgi:molybdopterin-guanine dinucleotide biosynthesis protein A
MTGFDAIVLAGGRATRLGGVDKVALDVGGRTSLDRVLDAVAEAGTVVVVGPPRATSRPVTWRREDPPYAGPVEAVAAALDAVSSDAVVVLAGDAPLVDGRTVTRLLDALPGHDAALLVDADGQHQYLAAAYTRTALVGVSRVRSMRALVDALDVARVSDTAGAARDMDTWDDVASVRSAARERTTPMLEDWTAVLAAELGVADVEVDEELLLRVARDAAHSVARPAAPLTTFLVGYAAARGGGDPEAVRRAAEAASRLALDWAPPVGPGQ